MEFTMSQYASKDDLIEAQADYIAKLEQELEEANKPAPYQSFVDRLKVEFPDYSSIIIEICKDANDAFSVCNCGDHFNKVKAAVIGDDPRLDAKDFDEAINQLGR